MFGALQAFADKAQAQVATLAPAEKMCQTCKKLQYTGMKHCRVCDGIFCDKTCSKELELDIPKELLHPSRHESFNKGEKQQSVVCDETCAERVREWHMAAWKAEFKAQCNTIFLEFIEADGKHKKTFKEPGQTEDTLKQKALRVAQVAEYAAGVAGLGFYYTALKYAYYGREFYSLILKEDVVNALTPVVENLKEFKVLKSNSDYKALIYLYYLGCKHELERKIDPTIEFKGHELGDEGIISHNCPGEILDDLAEYLPAAQFLYASRLQKPYHSNEWSCWYLCELTKRQGWTVLVCVNDSKKLPNGTKVPAFALLARTNSSTGEKEALLIVRGTHQAMDWSINLSEEPHSFTYKAGSLTSSLSPVSGFVHKGMYEGAKGILDEYGLRDYISSLSCKGYSIVCAGHSLGAGTAALLAMELKNGFAELVSESSGVEGVSHSIRALGFGCPPILCENLSDAVFHDGLVTVAVLNNDVVPRFSRLNVAELAQELGAFVPVAKKLYDQDYNDVASYVRNLGRAGNAHHSSQGSVHAEDEPREKGEGDGNSGADGDAGRESEIGAGGEGPTKKILRLVPPGKIVHIYSNSSGSYSASLCNHRLPALRRLKLLFDKGLDDHHMSSHWAAFRNMRAKRGFEASSRALGRSLTNPLPSTLRCSIKKTASSADMKSAGGGAVAALASVAEPAPAPAYSSFADLRLAGDPPRSPASALQSSSSTSVTKVAQVSPWVSCEVCELDVTWPCVSHSDATRSRQAVNCSNCGCVCCVVCAPAGDTVLGDGIQEKITLPDWKIAIPSLGHIVPTRVCAHCYLDSYSIL